MQLGNTNPCSPGRLVATPTAPASSRAAPARPRVPASTLYSTLQCILSMVGSIGVILLFAGIPQLIYSSSVQLSNLMTFLLGASLITAMVAGNAFVNYKYRKYCNTHPQVPRENRPSSAENPETPVDKSHSDEPPDYFEINEHPPSYQDVAAMYQWRWGHMPERRPSTVSASSQNGFANTPSSVNRNDPQGQSSSRANSVVAGPSGISPGKTRLSDGQVNCAFVSSCSDLTAIDNQKPPSRKISAASITDELKHQFFSKFMRSASLSTNELEVVPKSSDNLPEQETKKTVVPKQRKSNLFSRSPSEGGFESLPPLGTARKESYVYRGDEAMVESLPCDHTNVRRESEHQLAMASCSFATMPFECGSTAPSSSSRRASLQSITKSSQLPEVHITVIDTGCSGPSDSPGPSLPDRTNSPQQELGADDFRPDYGSCSSISDCEEGQKTVESFDILSQSSAEAPSVLSLVSYDPAQPSRNVRRSLGEMYAPPLPTNASASSLTCTETNEAE